MEDSVLELKERIVDAAIVAFNESGARFTLQEVSRLLNISKKTIYTCFESKEALIEAMITTGFESVKESERLIIEEPNLSTLEKIRKVVVIIPEKYADLDFKKFESIKARYPKLYKQILDHIETEWEPTIALIEQGMREGVIRQLPIPVLKTIIEASMERFLEGELDRTSGMDYIKALDWMMTILLEGITSEKGETR